MATASLWNIGEGSAPLPPPSTRAFHALIPSGNIVPVVVGCHVNFFLEQVGNYQLQNPSGDLQDGMIINILLIQDAAGGRILTYGSKYKFAAATVPPFVTTAGALNFLCAMYMKQRDIWICSWLPNLASA